MWRTKEEFEAAKPSTAGENDASLDLDNIKTPPKRELFSEKLAIFLEKPKAISQKKESLFAVMCKLWILFSGCALHQSLRCKLSPPFHVMSAFRIRR
jgi:hypothetical protein